MNTRERISRGPFAVEQEKERGPFCWQECEEGTKTI